MVRKSGQRAGYHSPRSAARMARLRTWTVQESTGQVDVHLARGVVVAERDGRDDRDDVVLVSDVGYGPASRVDEVCEGLVPDLRHMQEERAHGLVHGPIPQQDFEKGRTRGMP